MDDSKTAIITIYGINNLGKSTQVKILVDKLKNHGMACSLKYPIYDLEPSGPMIWKYLRDGNPFNLNPREAQILYTFNRLHFEARLQKEYLFKHDFVVLEDYTGTGLAWGIGAGVDKKFLLKINQELLKEDLAILLDGERFLEGKEIGHKHETDDELTEKVRQTHLELAKEFGWRSVNANQTKKQVSDQIYKIVANKFLF